MYLKTSCYMFMLMAADCAAVIRLELDNKRTILEHVARFLPAEPVVLEAGAFDGVDTVFMKEFWPKSIIYSFEPVPEAYHWLMSKASGYKDIYCFGFALSNKTGFKDFFLSEHCNNPGVTLQSGSLLAPKEHLIYAPHVSFKSKIIVPTITLDQWARLYAVSKIDLLWLDLQGMELSVLKAAPEVLKSVSVVYTEVEFVEAYENQDLYTDMQVFMQEQGFVEYARNFEAPGIGGWEWFGDVMFVRSDLMMLAQ